MTRFGLVAFALLLATVSPAKADFHWPWSGGGLVAAARVYMGTNPTGWRHVWCGRFMAMIAPAAAARIRNPNVARAWAQLPHVGGCQIGAVAVMPHHVGVVSGCEGRAVRIVSGNHGHRVGEGDYPAGRIIAFVRAE